MRRDPAVFRKFTFNRSAQEGVTFPAVRKKHPIALSSNIDLRGLKIVPGMPTADHPKDFAALLQHVGIDEINVACTKLHDDF